MKELEKGKGVKLLRRVKGLIVTLKMALDQLDPLAEFGLKYNLINFCPELTGKE